MASQQRTALISVVAAAFLVALKLVTGLVTGSLGFVAEAAHSGTDLVAALLTLFAVRVAVRPADREHPYGHGKAEHLSALAEGAALVLIALVIGGLAIRRLSQGDDAGEVEATWWAFVVLGVVLGVDLTRATVSRRASREHGSAALAANALHFASDFAGTLAVLVGLVFVRAGVEQADPIAALGVAVLVVAAAVRLMRQNVDVLMDTASLAAERLARAAIRDAEPRSDLTRLRLREAGGRQFVEATLAVDPDAGLASGHAVADSVEDAVRVAMPGSDVTVHIEPREDADARARATGAALSVRRVREVHNVRLIDLGDGTELSLHVKLPADVALGDAHGIADRIERAVHDAVGDLERVHVHLEPLAAPLSAQRASLGERHEHEEDIEAVVRRHTGDGPREVRLHREPRGLVAFVTVALPAEETLTATHDVARAIEHEVQRVHPDIAEVVVHTEPGG